MTQSGELTLELKRVVPAAPSVVFGAFSAADELAKWWGPKDFTVPSLDFKPRVGDNYRIEGSHPKAILSTSRGVPRGRPAHPPRLYVHI